jgi:hypothetical protein
VDDRLIKFEVAVYNAEVRRLVRAGDRHRQLSDDWADTHYIEIMARDEAHARSKIESRYPADKGFVIEQVRSVD